MKKKTKLNKALFWFAIILSSLGVIALIALVLRAFGVV